MKKLYPFRLAMLCLLLLLFASSEAQVSIVTTTADCNTAGCGSLRRAIGEANAFGAATATRPYVIDASGITGTITLNSSLPGFSNHIVLKGPESGELVIDGGDVHRVMTVNAGNVVTLNNLTITRGRAFDRAYTTYAIGGAGINNFGFLTLNNCTIKNCKAVPVSPSTVTSFGGGICMQGSATLTLNNSTLLNNESNGAGGGIYCQTENVVTITNSTLEGNRVVGSSNHRGGGIYIFNSDVTISNSTLTRNEALGAGSHGGAIWAQSSTIRSSTLNMTNCTVAFNFARGFAGGVGVNSSAGDKEVTAVLSHCTIAGNHCYNNNGTQATSTTNGGGGIRTNNTSALLTLNNSIVVGNTQGEAATSATTLPLPNGSVQGGAGRNIFNSSSSVTNSETGYNTVGGPSTSPGFTFTGTTTGNQVAIILYGDYFGANTLANNGGTTQTIAISPTTGFATATQATNLVSFDQRNLLRQRVNNAFTRGAWERNVSSPTLANVEASPGLFVVATPALPAEPVTSSLTVATNNNTFITEAAVSITGGLTAGDDLQLPAQPYYGLTWTYNIGTLNLTGSGTTSLYQQAFRAVLFSATEPGSGSRTLQFSAKEGSVTSNLVSRNLTVNEAAPPSLTGIEGEAVPYQSGKLGEPLSKTLSATASFANLQSAVVSIKEGFQPDDELAFENMDGITGVWNSDSRQLTLTGSASVALYGKALQSVLFQNSRQTGVSGSRTIEVVVSDGYNNSNAVSRTVAVSDYQRAGCAGEKVYPIGFPLIDITKPPYNAVPNDPAKAGWNTAALQAAMNDVKVGGIKERYAIYLPVGTFYINNTLTGGTSDFTDHYYYFQGQCRENTVLRLVDGAEGFGNPADPKVMLSFFEGSFTNNAYRNQLNNLTLHTGSGNSGAIAVKFVANNSGGIRDVTVTSTGGASAGAAAGVTAIDLTFSLSGISLLKNIKVEGFQRAFHAARQHCTFTLENIFISGQSSEGLLVDNKPLTIRKLESHNEVPAIRSINGGSLINVLQSQLNGGAPGASAIVNNAGNHLLLRDVTASGYGNLLSGSHTLTTLPASGEFATATFSNNPEAQRTTLGQAIPDVPEVAWEYDFTKWAIIDGGANDNGAIASDFNSVVDDAPVIQAAINEGKTFIVFKRFIDIRTRVTVGNQLRQILGNWNDVNIRQPVRNGEPTFALGTNIAFQLENTGGPLKLESFKSPFAASQFSVLFNNNRTEDVVLADMDYPKALFYRNTGSGRAFFEMINAVKPTPADVTDGQTIGEHPIIEIKNGKAFFWSLDLEIQDFHCQGDCEPLFSNDGGNAVIIGAKFGERDGLWFGMKNGSKTEIFGAVLNVSKDGHIVPADKFVLVNDKSDVSASLVERSGRATNSTTRSYHTKFIQEKDNCEGVREFNTQYAATDNVLPLRAGAGFEAQGTVVPLYVGRYAQANAAPLVVEDLEDATTAAIGEKRTIVASREGATAPVVYTLVNTPETVATLQENEITILGAGTVTVAISQACDANFSATTTEKSFVVKKQSQTIVFDDISHKTYGDAPFTLTATSSAHLPVSFLVKTGSATIDGNTLTITGAGTVEIEAVQAGNELFVAAEVVSKSFTVKKALLTAKAADAERAYNTPNPSFQVTLTGFVNNDEETAIADKPVATTVATQSSAAGTYPITVTGGTAVNYLFQYENGTLTIQPASQTIHFLPLADVVYQSSPLLTFELTGASASSGLPVVYTVVGPATVNGNLLTITGIGPVSVTASQAGIQNYTAAAQVVQNFNVTTTDKEKGVKPILECVVAEGGGQYRAWFGYKNDMAMPVYIPVGASNYLSPSTLNGLQVQSFAASISGRFQYQFSVPFSAGNTVSWSVAGPDGKLRTATATVGTPVCTQAITTTTAARTPVNETILNASTGLVVSPNPSAGVVRVSWSQEAGKWYELTIFDVTGKMVLRRSGSNKMQELLDLSHLAKGLYHVQLRTTDGVLQQKLVIQ